MNVKCINNQIQSSEFSVTKIKKIVKKFVFEKIMFIFK